MRSRRGQPSSRSTSIGWITDHSILRGRGDRRRDARSTRGLRRLRVASAVLVALLGAATILAGSCSGQTNEQLAADTVFVDGQVLLYPNSGNLMSHLVSWAQAVAVKDGRITFVGNSEGARSRIGPNTKVIDLKGRILMPGLGDGHLHGGVEGSTCAMGYEGGTVEAILAKIKACLLRDDQVAHLKSNFALRPDQFNVNGIAPAGTTITRHDLDRLSRDPSQDQFGTGTTRPIVIGDMGGHQTFTNTKAIANAGLGENTVQPPRSFIGRDPNGYPNGQFSDFLAQRGPSVPREPDADYRAAVADYRNANRVGITMILHPGGDVGSLRVLKQVADDGKLTVRVNRAISAGRSGEDRPSCCGQAHRRTERHPPTTQRVQQCRESWRRHGGHRERFCDGIAEFPGETAAMLHVSREHRDTAEARFRAGCPEG